MNVALLLYLTQDASQASKSVAAGVQAVRCCSLPAACNVDDTQMTDRKRIMERQETHC